MTKQYKRKDDAYDSAHDWLYEKGYEIIVVNKEPARALGFITGFHKKFQEQNIQINECGIDATCKFILLLYFLLLKIFSYINKLIHL